MENPSNKPFPYTLCKAQNIFIYIRTSDMQSIKFRKQRIETKLTTSTSSAKHFCDLDPFYYFSLKAFLPTSDFHQLK